MLTSKDITELLSGFYSTCSLQQPEKMLLIAELLETMRPQLENKNTYALWDYPKLDKDRFGNDVCINVLTELRQACFELLFSKQFEEINLVAEKDQAEAFSKLRQYYAEALVHFHEDFICLLYKQPFSGITGFSEWVDKISRVSLYLTESRWADLYSFYQEIFNDPGIQVQERCLAAVISGEIVLYNFPDPLTAEKDFQDAINLLPDNIIAKRGWGEFCQKKGDLQKAKAIYLEIISKEAGDYTSYNLLGDCFLEDARIKKLQEEEKNKDEAKPMEPDPQPGMVPPSKDIKDENKELTAQNSKTKPVTDDNLNSAEFWYNSGWGVNFLQTESCRRLINLYSSDNDIFAGKEGRIEELLKEVEQLNWYPRRSRFRFTDKKFAACFNDSVYYIACKDLAANYVAAGLYDKSEELYKKAIQLRPELSAAYIDLANQKIAQKQLSQARKYLDKALKSDSANYETHWAMAYLFEESKNKEEAIKAYERCYPLRPYWADWIDNFIGNVYYDYEEYEKALSYYRKAIEKKPGYKIYRDNLLLSLQYAGEAKEEKDLTDEAASLYLQLAEERNDAKDWNRLGKLYFKQKKYTDAEQFYSRAITLDPAEPVYHENLGLIYERQGLNDKAENKFKEAISLNTKDGGSLNQMGLFYYEQGKYTEALHWYNDALKKEPDNTDFLYNIAMAYDKNNNTTEAITFYLEAAKREPGSDDIQNRIGLMYFRQDDHKNAIAYFKNAAKLNKLNPVYVENIASSYRILGKTDLAEKNLEEAIKIKPDEDFAYNELGRIYFEKKDYNKAIEFCKRAAEINPANSQYFENLGYAYSLINEEDNAILNFKEAVRADNKNSIAYNELGRVYFKNGRYQDAIDVCKEALKYDPDNWQYYENMGLAYDGLEDSPAAIDAYKKALSLNEKSYTSLNALGINFYRQNLYDKAIEYYTKALALQPNDPTFTTNLALAYRDSGAVYEAIDSYEKAVKLDENDYLNLNDLANLYCTVNEPVKAIPYYDKAISIKPSDQNLFVNKALAYVQLGDFKEAEKVMNENHLDENSRNDFSDQVKIIFPSIQVNKNAKDSIFIKSPD